MTLCYSIAWNGSEEDFQKGHKRSSEHYTFDNVEAKVWKKVRSQMHGDLISNIE